MLYTFRFSRQLYLGSDINLKISGYLAARPKSLMKCS